MLRSPDDQAAAHGAPPFAPRWPNSKALLVGYLTGIGRTARAIAEHLADGTSSETIRAQWRRQGICDRREGTEVRVALTTHELTRLHQLAADRGFEPDEWLRRVAAAAIRDDLFNAVVDETPALPKCGWGGDRKSKAFLASRLTQV